MHNRHLNPQQDHDTILQPAPLPSAEISDAQPMLFAADFTELTGTLNFKIHLKCKVEMSQVTCLILSPLSVVEMDLILVFSTSDIYF